jgi:hypothetical protein
VWAALASWPAKATTSAQETLPGQLGGEPATASPGSGSPCCCPGERRRRSPEEVVQQVVPRT